MAVAAKRCRNPYTADDLASSTFIRFILWMYSTWVDATNVQMKF